MNIKDELPQYEKYQDSLVAFIDILGFDKKVKAIRNETDFANVSILLQAAKTTADNFNNDENVFKRFKFTAISDSIIVSVPFSDPVCTVGLLTILHKIQYELLATSFKTLVRGYINRGPVYHADGLLFGSGYSDAYGGEKLIGNAPRIVLSPSIVEVGKRVVSQYSGKEEMVSFFELIKEDPDGFYFIDYLKPVGSPRALPKEQINQERESIKNFIHSSLEEFKDDYRVLPKYKWLNNYFKQMESQFK